MSSWLDPRRIAERAEATLVTPGCEAGGIGIPLPTGTGGGEGVETRHLPLALLGRRIVKHDAQDAPAGITQRVPGPVGR